jgi:nitroreductase
MDEKTRTVMNALRMRRSTREFTGESIPDEDIEYILDAARYAPSPENMQTWRYVVIKEDVETKKFLGELCKKAASELFGSAPYELTQARLWYVPPRSRPATFEEMREGDLFAYPGKCSVAIIGCASESSHDSFMRYPLDVLGSISVAMGIFSMWLVAHSMGYGAGYQALPVMELRRRQLLCDRLGIPGLWVPIATLFVGVPEVKRMVGPSRFPIESVCYAERWGNPYMRHAFTDEEE